MGTRLELHNELVKFLPTVYFQPPTNLQLKYPCIVYTKRPKSKEFGNNAIYLSKQGYQLTVITTGPDNDIADIIEQSLQYCTITQNFVVDGLYHTTLNLYY